MLNEKKYIDAVALIEELEYYRSHGNSVFYKNTVESDIKTVKQQPAADVEEVRHGHWQQIDATKCKCSNCEIITLIAQYPHGDKNYCPNCGAKMGEPLSTNKTAP